MYFIMSLPWRFICQSEGGIFIQASARLLHFIGVRTGSDPGGVVMVYVFHHSQCCPRKNITQYNNYPYHHSPVQQPKLQYPQGK